MRGCLWCVSVAYYLLYAHAAYAMEGRLNKVEVTEHQGTYTISMDALAGVPLAGAWRLLTDYPNLHLLNDAIKQSKVLGAQNDTQHLLQVDAEACVLLYCKRLLTVQNVLQQPYTRIMATMIPALSSFSYGEARLELRARGQTTHMRFHASIIPKFWVPPYIGIWLLEWKIRAEARDTLTNMERLAATDHRQPR